MIVLGTVALFVVGIVLLGLIVRDTRLRMHSAELAEKRRALTEEDQAALVGMGRRIAGCEGSLKDQSDRILALERRQPAPRRA